MILKCYEFLVTTDCIRIRKCSEFLVTSIANNILHVTYRYWHIQFIVLVMYLIAYYTFKKSSSWVAQFHLTLKQQSTLSDAVCVLYPSCIHNVLTSRI